jgi:regulator of cell morphogenesis and NO signaling
MTKAVSPDNLAALTDHIEVRFHAAHRRQLPDLVRLAEMVEDLHAGEAGAPAGLAALLRRMNGELEVHMKKEELLLFPLVRRGAGAVPRDRIAALRADHGGHDADMAAIRRLTDGLSPPPGACTPWITLYGGLAVFLDDLAEHIRLENEALFPWVEAQADG